MERSPAPAPGPSTLSPDGQFFWDGRQWVPTVTGDGRWHWNGAGWEPTAAIDPGNPQALAQTLLIQAEETYARAGALLAARRGEWTVDPAAQGHLARADQLAAAVQVDNAQLTTMNQQNVINRALASNDRKRIETDLGQAAAALRAVIVQIGRGAPSTTFPDGDLLLLAARNTEAQAAAINEALVAQQQAEAAYVARLTAAQQRLQQAEGARGSALARAGESVQAAQHAHDEAVAVARAQLGELRMPGSGAAVSAFATAAAYENHIQTTDGRGLMDGCEVFVGTAGELWANHADLAAEAMVLSSAGAAPFHEAETQKPGAGFLLIGARGLRSIVAVPAGQERAAADFAVRATEAARAAGASAAGRRAEEQAAQALLDTVTTDRSASRAAERERKRIEADPELLRGIESAKAAVAAALANTAEVEAARGRPAELVAAAVTPPAPPGAGTGV